jgi:hypothetical protein
MPDIFTILALRELLKVILFNSRPSYTISLGVNGGKGMMKLTFQCLLRTLSSCFWMSQRMGHHFPFITSARLGQSKGEHFVNHYSHREFGVYM